jgi:hypothetical protein
MKKWHQIGRTYLSSSNYNPNGHTISVGSIIGSSIDPVWQIFSEEPNTGSNFGQTKKYKGGYLSMR